MASVNTQSTANLEKRVYGWVKDAIPNNSKLPRMLKKPTIKIGEQFEFLVDLVDPHGTLWSDSKTSTAMPYPVSGYSAKAVVDAKEFYINDDIANSLYRRSKGSGSGADGSKGNERAFADAKLHTVKKMIRAAMTYKEIALLYGQDDIGVFTSTSNVNSTTSDITFTEGSWSPAIWKYLEGGYVTIYDESDVQVGSGNFLVGVTTASSRTVRVTGASGDITALDAVDDSWYAVPANGFGAKDDPAAMAGLKKILSNTGSLFNINAASYSRWQASTTNVGGAFTFSKLRGGLVEVATQGSLTGKLCLLTSPASVGDLSLSLDDQIRYMNNDKSKNVGSVGLTYFMEGCEVEVVAHPLVKQGDAFLFPKNDTHRVRSHEDEVFWDLSEGGNSPQARSLEGFTGRRLRCGFEEALFIGKPNCCHYFSGITPTLGN